jgi:High-temperature-induced dauer-formation protein
MRVLTRLFPFLFEVDDLREWQDRFWWTKRRKRPRGLVQGAVKIRQTGEAGAEEGEDEEVLFEGAGVNEGDIPLVQAPISRVESDEGMERSKPLAEELLDTVLDFLSFAGFTIPSTYNQSPDAPRVTLAIW